MAGGMAQIGELFSRIVGTGATRGLSGDADPVLPLEPAYDFFNERLRKHRAGGDLVAEPELLWRAGGRGGRRGGLEGHLQAARTSAPATWTDVLLILSGADWARALGRLDRPWTEDARTLLRARFERYCQENDLHRPFPQRPMGFRLLVDGGVEMQGARLGLEAGEFVTGLLPGFYGGPREGSRPVVSFHLHIPGAWEGYREVGRLYNDQLLFTLGSHWLDNFQHPKLFMPGLYRLQQFSDGSFVHLINPEAMDEVSVVTEGEAGGPSVLTLRKRGGDALAHLVIAITDPLQDPIFMEDTLSLDGASAARLAGSSTLPALTPGVSGGLSARTVVPVEVEERLLTLREQGVLLQRVHFGRFMDGYDVYIGRKGEVGTAIVDPALTLQVREDRVELLAHHGDVRVSGEAVPPGLSRRLRGDHRISVGARTIEYRDLSKVEAAGWPYLAELRRSGATLRLVFGRRHRVGRDPRSAVRLPDEPHNGNIVWKPEIAKGATIRSRNGDIPKSRFYIDSIMVASEHAELDLNEEPVLSGLARDCFTFVRRQGEVLAIHPARQGEEGPRTCLLLPDDEVLVGNSVFRASFPPVRTGEVSAAGPLTIADLASALDELEGEAPSGAVAPVLVSRRTPADLPAARGFGERGPIPPKPELASTLSEDSLLTPGWDAATHRVPPPTPITDPMGAPPPRDVAPPGPEPKVGPPMLLDPAPVVGPPMLLDPSPVVGPPMLLESPPPSVGRPMLLEPAPVIGPPMLLDPAVEAPTGPISQRTPDKGYEALLEAPSLSPQWASRKVDPHAAVTAQLPPDFDPEVFEARPTFQAGPLLRRSGRGGRAELEERPTGFAAPSGEFAPEALSSGMLDGISRPTSAADLPEGPPPPILTKDAVEVAPTPITSARPALVPPPVPGAERPLGDLGTVVVVEEHDWQLELGRPARLVHIGWMVGRPVTIGNHRGAELIVPENRAEPSQQFVASDYATLHVRGRSGQIHVSSSPDARLSVSGVACGETRDLANGRLEIVRRDLSGEEDFVVTLRVVEDPGLPDPRARLVVVNREDPMVAGLFTLGLPLRTARRVRLGPISATLAWDGADLKVHGYLEEYLRPDGSFVPMFVQNQGQPFRTFPEDGGTVRILPGDRLLCGLAVYQLVTEGGRG